MPNRLAQEFENNSDTLNIATSNLKKSLTNQRVISRANYNNLSQRLTNIQFKMKDLIDDIEELQYDFDKEQIKERPDPQTEDRIKDFEKNYEMLKPVLGLALASYINTL